MGLEVELYLDTDGLPRARGGLPARFLEADLQGDRALAAELLRRLDAVADGARENDELIGNAHRLELGPRGARIEALFDSAVAPALLSLAELRRLVSAWIALIERAPDD
jgi:hypothetical protein